MLILSVVSAVVCGFLPPYSMMLRFRWTWVAAMHFLWTAIFVTQLAMLRLAPRRYAILFRFLIVLRPRGWRNMSAWRGSSPTFAGIKATVFPALTLTRFRTAVSPLDVCLTIRYFVWREASHLASWAYLAIYLQLVMGPGGPVLQSIPEVAGKLNSVNQFAIQTGIMCLSWLALQQRVRTVMAVMRNFARANLWQPPSSVCPCARQLLCNETCASTFCPLLYD